MANKILSAKLNELDKDFKQLHGYIKLSETADISEIEKEIEILKNEISENKKSLCGKMKCSKAEIVNRLADTYNEIGELIDTTSIESALSKPGEFGRTAVEERILLAEYALDFAMQAANRALLISMQAIYSQEKMQKSEEEI